MVRILAVIPFFGGTSSASHSKEEMRLDYLAQTTASLTALDFDLQIVQAKKDPVEVPGGSIRLDVDPIHLPWAACTAAQQSIVDSGTQKLVYVTEADQVLHVHDEDVYKIPDDTRYLAPWRLDMVGPNGEAELAGVQRVQVGDAEYSITNGGHHLRGENDPWGVLKIHANQQAFSGAFLCTADFFRRIKFRKMRVLPVEHATGFDANSTGDCVKTASVERCWLDHLSPREKWSEVN